MRSPYITKYVESSDHTSSLATGSYLCLFETSGLCKEAIFLSTLELTLEDIKTKKTILGHVFSSRSLCNWMYIIYVCTQYSLQVCSVMSYWRRFQYIHLWRCDTLSVSLMLARIRNSVTTYSLCMLFLLPYNSKWAIYIWSTLLKERELAFRG